MDIDYEEEYLILDEAQETVFFESLDIEELPVKNESGAKSLMSVVELDENDLSDIEDVEMEQQAVESPSQQVDDDFSCDKCSKRGLSRHQLQYHMISEHSGHDGPFECPICLRLYPNREKFYTHFYRHKDGNAPLCTR